MPRYGMVVDVTKCDGCYNCFIACKDEYCEQAHPPYTVAQPMTGHFWLKIIGKERGQFPKVKQDYITMTCMHCEAPSCMSADNDFVYQREDGIVLIDPEKAKGEKDLVRKCPYRVIYWNEEENVAQKCTFCAHLLDAGWKEPRCVEACPTGALLFGDLDDPDSELSKVWKKAVPMHPEYKLGEKVRFIGLPKNFVAGAVAYGDTDECAKGVTVTLTGEDVTKTVETDAFGDFEFEDLPDNHAYKLTIAAPGYKTWESDVRTYKSLYLGDILLQK
jgi:Fe-S-cluster-containing dehydrogenase component